MTDTQRKHLCAKITAMAAEFAADPEKGHRSGYRPAQKYHRGESMGGLDEPAQIPLRDSYTAWLYGIAGRDLRGLQYTIIDCAEGQAELVIL